MPNCTAGRGIAGGCDGFATLPEGLKVSSKDGRRVQRCRPRVLPSWGVDTLCAAIIDEQTRRTAASGGHGWTAAGGRRVSRDGGVGALSRSGAGRFAASRARGSAERAVSLAPGVLRLVRQGAGEVRDAARHVVDGESATAAASLHGYSRASFYLVQAAFERSGMVGLLDERPGRRGPVKLSPEVLTFLQAHHRERPGASGPNWPGSWRRRWG